jgi:hypothetical protein
MSQEKTFKINIYEIIGGNGAVTSDDGQIIFERIDKAFREDYFVTLDFNNVDLIVSTFLNASIGQLYGFYTPEFIRKHFKVENLSNDDLTILSKVIERAKQYFANKKNFEDSANSAIYGS